MPHRPEAPRAKHIDAPLFEIDRAKRRDFTVSAREGKTLALPDDAG
jgi:hypothetical protein